MSKVLILLLFSFQIFPSYAQCNALSGWADLEAVTTLAATTQNLLNQESGSETTSYFECRNAASAVVVAYEEIKDLARQDYDTYRSQLYDQALQAKPIGSQMKFLRRFLSQSQVGNAIQGFLNRRTPSSAEKNQLFRQIKDRLKYNLRNQRINFPNGPTIFPPVGFTCHYEQSDPSNLSEEHLITYGRHISTENLCYRGNAAPRNSRVFQKAQNNLSIEVENDNIYFHYCQSEFEAEVRMVDLYFTETHRMYLDVKAKCYTYDYVNDMFVNNDGRRFSLETERRLDPRYYGFERDISDAMDDLEINPQSPNFWWGQKISDGSMPSFESFFRQNIPTQCLEEQSSLMNFMISAEDNRQLRRRPPFWHWTRIGLEPPRNTFMPDF